MNWQHFHALLWVRWRLLVNQMRRGGPVNAIAAGFLAVIGVLAALVMFGSFLFVGLFAFPKDYPDALLYVWDGLVVAFIFSWMIGLIIELQRSEVLSLDKLMHLPVSLKGAFLINYLSSFFSMSLIVFVPAMVALSLGVLFTWGPSMLVVLPLLAAFIVMVTALTYQFQGWLASLITNPRRRRTVIVMVTMGVILMGQVPNLVNIIFIRSWANTEDPAITEFNDRQEKLGAARNAGEIDEQVYKERQQENEMQKVARQRELKEDVEQRLETSFVIGNAIVPPGWLPLGAEFAAKQNVLPGLLGTLGFAGIAWLSLWRAYQTTVRLYTGQFTAGKKAAVAAIDTSPPAVKKATSALRLNVLEWRLPWVSEPAAAVALGGFRSLIRAPEAKMMLLTPLIMVVVFGSLFMSNVFTPKKSKESKGAQESLQQFIMPEFVPPLVAYGAMSMALLSIGQFVGNQFGFDRGGFRALVLSAAPRRQILLGKNLAFAPLGLGLGLLVSVLVQVIYPVRIDVFLAEVPQLLSMYLLFCMVANWLSIMAPMSIRAGTMKPVNPKVFTVLLHVFSVLLYPVVLAPVLLPLVAHLLVEEVAGIRYLPVDLVLSVLLCALVFFLYQAVLTSEGQLLRRRELKILEAATAKTE